MVRDLFRGIIRMLVVVLIIVSCAESFYFMGQLSDNRINNAYNSRYYNYNSRSSTKSTVEYAEEVDVDSIQNTDDDDGYYY